MPVLPPQQQPNNWDSNIYVVTVTRILVFIGVTYLIRSVYQYITRLRLPNDGNRIAGTLSSDLLALTETPEDSSLIDAAPQKLRQYRVQI